MKQKILIIAALLSPLLTFAQLKLSGTISSADTKQTLPGAHISLIEKNWATISDASGNFEFIKLGKGEYTLRVSYIGFENKYLDVILDNDKHLSIQLKPTPYLSDEIIVSASRAAHNSPITYSVIDREQLQQNNTGADLPYLLRSTPSVVVTSDAGAGIGYTGIRIRGSDLTRINVTINGVPVNDPESHGVFFVNMPDLVSSIDNMHIQRGVGSSVNGTAAFGASINIKTDMVQKDAYAELHTGFGSFNTLRNTLQFGTGMKQNGFSLNGRLSKITSDGYIDRGWSNLKSFYMAASWQSKSSLVKLIATSGQEKTYQAWNGIPKDSLQTNRRYNPSGEMRDASGNIYGYYDNQTDNYQQDYYQLHLAHRFNRDVFVNATAFLTKGAGYYENWRNNDRLSNYGLPNVQIGDETISRTDLIRQKWLDNDFYGFNAALHYEKPKTGLVIGGGWNRYKGDHFGHVAWARFPSTSTPDWRYYENNGDKTDYTFFARANRLIVPKLNLYLDLQYRKIFYAINGIHDNLMDISQVHNFSFLNPKAGLHYEIDKHNSFYVAIGASNREPNRSVYRDADASQEIHSEQLIDLEMGHRFMQQQWLIETNFYNMVYKNQLVLTGKINNVGAPILTNVAESYRRGIELSMQFKPRYNLLLTGNFTLSSNKIIDFVEFVDNWNYWDNPDLEPYQYVFEHAKTDISFSPAVITGGSINYSPITGSHIVFSTNYVSRQYLDNTSNTDRSIDPYVVSDLALTYTLSNSIVTGWARELVCSLHLNNVFNQLYEANGWVYRYIYDGNPYVMDGYFPQAGFHWMASVRIGF
jgi:iron complex outermembrane recepter protein